MVIGKCKVCTKHFETENTTDVCPVCSSQDWHIVNSIMGEGGDEEEYGTPNLITITAEISLEITAEQSMETELASTMEKIRKLCPGIKFTMKDKTVERYPF